MPRLDANTHGASSHWGTPLNVRLYVHLWDFHAGFGTLPGHCIAGICTEWSSARRQGLTGPCPVGWLQALSFLVYISLYSCRLLW